jgi:ATP-dependent DNA helicase RecG
MRGIDDDYCKKLIIDYLKEFSEGTRADFEAVLLEKLPDVLNEQQKKTKIKNILQTLRKSGVIYLSERKKWRMSKQGS